MSPVRVHRILGCLAILHSGLLLLFRSSAGRTWMDWHLRLWIGLAILWLFWPLIFVLHPARSARRVLIPLMVAAPFVFFWFGLLFWIAAAFMFNLPDEVDIQEDSVVQYAASYGRGWLDAKRDIKSGRVVFEGYGFGGNMTPGAPAFSSSSPRSLEQCRVEIRPVALCSIDTRIVGHAKGYNDVMVAALRQRCPDLVKSAEDEDARWTRSLYEGAEAGRADARRDLNRGQLVFEVTDPPSKGDMAFEKMLRERYQLGFRRVNPDADPRMANYVFGHATGYDEVVYAEVEHHFGKPAVDAVIKASVDRLYADSP